MKITMRRLAAVGVATLAAVVVGASTVPASASPVTSKGAPPNPTIGQYSQTLAAPVTGEAKTLADSKIAAAQQLYATAKTAWAAQAAGGVKKTPMACIPACPPPTPPAAKTLPVPLYQQQTENWCGPTTLAMIAEYKGVGFAGTTYNKELAAAELVTDPGSGSTWDARSTDWYGADSVPSGPWSSWYPMQDALNYKTHNSFNNWYAPVALPGSPTSAQQSDYRSALVTDTYKGWPFASNQDSIPGYQIGYQPSGNWQHWWAAIGYQSNGNTTVFNDPASWSQGRTSYAPTTGGAGTVVVALGGRGYVW